MGYVTARGGGRKGRDMRKEWWNRGYADGVAYLGDGAVCQCPNCGTVARVFAEHDGCGSCVLASLQYSQRHGILWDGLADVHTFGRFSPRVIGTLTAGFFAGVRDGIAGVRA